MRYALKYALKTDQKKVPYWAQLKPGRFWGATTGVKESVKILGITPIDEAQLREMLHKKNDKRVTWDVLPRYLFGLEMEPPTLKFGSKSGTNLKICVEELDPV